MKKIIASIVSFILFALFLLYLHQTFSDRIHQSYYDKVGEIASDNKFKSLVLLREAAGRGDNLFICGSSELEFIMRLPFHPSTFFADKKDGFQVYLIGKGGFQCLVHAIYLGAVGNAFKGQKIVFILSQSWFGKAGIDQNALLANASEEAIYAFMCDSYLDRELKARMAKRISEIIRDDRDFKSLKLFCELQWRDDMLSKACMFVLQPYFRFRYYIDSIKDEIKSDTILINSGKMVKNITPGHAKFDWEKEKQKAEAYGKKVATNNPFYFDNNTYKFFNTMGLIEKFKGSLKKASNFVSPEYDDFRLLMDIYRELGIQPLIVNVPVNGLWYDYMQWPSKEDRAQYYKNIDAMVTSYGFDLADFSNDEYEPFFLIDDIHLGWKGWIYFNEAIYGYYHKNDK